MKNKIYNEEVLVIKKKNLFPKEIPQGFLNFKNEIIEIIEKEHIFYDRNLAEFDENYKQIIPYMFFKYEDSYFLMQRKKNHALSEKYSLGIGGHLKKEDIVLNDIVSWGLREFEEEIAYDGKIDAKVLGFINDELDEIGKVHFAILILIEGDSNNIQIKNNEHLSGKLYKKNEILNIYNNLETWSKIIFDNFIL